MKLNSHSFSFFAYTPRETILLSETIYIYVWQCCCHLNEQLSKRAWKSCCNAFREHLSRIFAFKNLCNLRKFVLGLCFTIWIKVLVYVFLAFFNSCFICFIYRFYLYSNPFLCAAILAYWLSNRFQIDLHISCCFYFYYDIIIFFTTQSVTGTFAIINEFKWTTKSCGKSSEFKRKWKSHTAGYLKAKI